MATGGAEIGTEELDRKREKATTVIVLGMAGSGKTTFVQVGICSILL